MISIYLAGPDVFKPDAKEIGLGLSKLCENSGFKGNFPLDNEIEGDWSRSVLGEKIAEANKQMIRDSDIVLANLEPFRGPSADVGTVWECAYAKGLGKKVFGYNVEGYCSSFGLIERLYNNPTNKYYKDKVVGKLPHDGMLIEDFNVWDNIMVVYGLDYAFRDIYSALDYLKRFSDRLFKGIV